MKTLNVIWYNIKLCIFLTLKIKGQRKNVSLGIDSTNFYSMVYDRKY